MNVIRYEYTSGHNYTRYDYCLIYVSSDIIMVATGKLEGERITYIKHEL